jgi:hypothetical protein
MKSNMPTESLADQIHHVPVDPIRKPPPTATDEVFTAQLRYTDKSATADDFQEIVRRMCRSLSDDQGSLLYDFLFMFKESKNRDKVHRRFMQLLSTELINQSGYQREHQGEQGPPTGKYVGIKGPWPPED